jgi:hypothetical protein
MSAFLDDTTRYGRSVGLVHDYLLVVRGAERTFAGCKLGLPAVPAPA